MKRRYSIWGREHGSDHDVELAQVDSNPSATYNALKAKTLKVKGSIFKGGKVGKIPKYSWLRVEENTP